jgi:cystathionine beta-synthase
MESSVTTLRVGTETSAVVGNTPLVSLPRLAEEVAAEIVAKVEYFNPGDRSKTGSGWR